VREWRFGGLRPDNLRNVRDLEGKSLWKQRSPEGGTGKPLYYNTATLYGRKKGKRDSLGLCVPPTKSKVTVGDPQRKTIERGGGAAKRRKTPPKVNGGEACLFSTWLVHRLQKEKPNAPSVLERERGRRGLRSVITCMQIYQENGIYPPVRVHESRERRIKCKNRKEASVAYFSDGGK